MCQGAVRRLCNLSERCHARTFARLLARSLSWDRSMHRACVIEKSGAHDCPTVATRPRKRRRGLSLFWVLQVISEWRDPDSNRGHHDFQSCALPTELSRLKVGKE